MEAQEFDVALTELETRVDRLRALYENWFRGYEKTEPSVPRKDVERRVYGLRKELPRNTALRFRYHQLYQRFTTLATYWQRTAKQVEEGTYRLQLQRLRRKRDDSNARTLAPRPKEESDSLSPKSYELSLDETLNVSQLLDDFELDELASAIDAPGNHEAAVPARPSVSTRFARPKAGDDARAPRTPLTLESLERLTDIAALSTSAANDTASANRPHEGGGALRPLASRASGVEESARRSLPEQSAALASGQTRVNMAAGMAPRSGSLERPSQAQPPASRAAASAPAPPALPAQVARAAPSGPAANDARPAPSPRPAAQVPQPVTAAGQARPPAPPAPPRVPPPPPRTPPALSGAPAPQSAAMNDQHIRRIYDEYVAARRKNNEGEVRFETLASSIQKMMPDLQKRHQGKRIDFEVVLKDGRVGLKPKPV